MVVKVWVPVFTWKDRRGTAHYDVHGVEGWMVSNRDKRRGFEADIWGCFLYDVDKHPEKREARLTWMHIEVPMPTGHINPVAAAMTA